MSRRLLISVALVATAVGYVRVESASAIPAFARQYDLQCNVCHTRPPRLNRFGEQFHMMGFQIPSAARPGGLVGSLKEDGPVKTLIDSLALRIEGGLFEYTESPRETETKFASPDEITLFVARPLLPDLSFFFEIEGEPNAVVFEKGRYFTKGEVGLGKEAFFMLNLGRLLGVLGAPTMEMGGQTMVGTHGGFSMHGPMVMAGKVDPNTNFSYEKFVFGSTLPAITIGPCIENPPCVPTIVWPPISMVGAPRTPSRRPRFSMKNASLPRPTSPFVKYRPFSNTTALGSPSISKKKLRSGRSGRATKSVISSGEANLVSVSRGDSVYSNSPPSIRRARLSISVLIGPSSFRLPTKPPGRAALGIWNPIMWNCSPNRFSRGGRVWQTLHCRSYWRAKAGIATAEPISSIVIVVAANATRMSERLSMPSPLSQTRSSGPGSRGDRREDGESG